MTIICTSLGSAVPDFPLCPTSISFPAKNSTPLSIPPRFVGEGIDVLILGFICKLQLPLLATAGTLQVALALGDLCLGFIHVDLGLGNLSLGSWNLLVRATEVEVLLLD